jgi:formamidopyrimidine-DNA glycosylase
MPELPEVETTLQGINRVIGQKIHKVIVRQFQLRLPVTKTIDTLCQGRRICDVKRRAKYLIIIMDKGNLLIHLGMSGHLKLVSANTPIVKHDHVDIIFSNDICLRYHDPRRFGLITWYDGSPLSHHLLEKLGPEPLSLNFDGKYLWQCAQKRTIAVKNFIMDNQVVVGVGNIYATESLFIAKIAPNRKACDISKKHYQILAESIKKILIDAIKQGGTTLKDFRKSDGKPGYFSQSLLVYGRASLPCYQCHTPLQSIKLGQRASVYCPSCQHN